MHNSKVKIAHTQKELDSVLQLRYKILRQPWNQPFETATDNLEYKSVNAYIEDETGIVIACGRLQENENKVGQIRFMAVGEANQGKGLGAAITRALEEEGKKMGLEKIELQARYNAVKFYEKLGYVIKEKTFLLWGQIQHYLMEKNLQG